MFLRSFGLSSLAELPPLHGDEMSAEEVAARMDGAALEAEGAGRDGAPEEA